MSNGDCQNTIENRKNVSNSIKTCTCSEECQNYLTTKCQAKVLIICSGRSDRELIPKIHDHSQVHAIYIFCGNQALHTQWAEAWPKIKGVHTNIRPICEEIETVIKEINDIDVPMTFIWSAQLEATSHADQLDPSFMYTQLFKTAFLQMKYDKESINKFIAYCRVHYKDDPSELNIVQEFATEYHASKAVWWYTSQCFLFRMLNQSLRCLHADIMVDMDFFIQHLHQEIQRMHEEQLHSVFRIVAIKPMPNKTGIYRVHLTMTSDDDPQLRRLTEQLEAEDVDI
jgi:hypothetical protein